MNASVGNFAMMHLPAMLLYALRLLPMTGCFVAATCFVAVACFLLAAHPRLRAALCRIACAMAGVDRACLDGASVSTQLQVKAKIAKEVMHNRWQQLDRVTMRFMGTFNWCRCSATGNRYVAFCEQTVKSGENGTVIELHVYIFGARAVLDVFRTITASAEAPGANKVFRLFWNLPWLSGMYHATDTCEMYEPERMRDSQTAVVDAVEETVKGNPGRPVCVLAYGEPGAGKSTLSELIARRLQAPGAGTSAGVVAFDPTDRQQVLGNLISDSAAHAVLVIELPECKRMMRNKGCWNEFFDELTRLKPSMQVVVVATCNETPGQLLNGGVCFSAFRLGRMHLLVKLCRNAADTLVRKAPLLESEVRRRGMLRRLLRR